MGLVYIVVNGEHHEMSKGSFRYCFVTGACSISSLHAMYSAKFP